MKFHSSPTPGQPRSGKRTLVTRSSRVISRRSACAWAVAAVLICPALLAQPSGAEQAVSALGRLEPQGGTIHLAASSTPQSIMGGIIVQLHVEEGDRVSTGQLLATLDTAEVMEAVVTEAEAALQFALSEVEAARSQLSEM